MVTNNISEIRKEKHLSQDDPAVALGVCRKSIFNIEHNNVIPNIDTCLRLAKYLDMAVEDLFKYRMHNVFLKEIIIIRIKPCIL